jgi:hypothetical protein
LLVGDEPKFVGNRGERIAAQLDAQRRSLSGRYLDDRRSGLDRVAGLGVVDVGGVLPGCARGVGVVVGDRAFGAPA